MLVKTSVAEIIQDGDYFPIFQFLRFASFVEDVCSMYYVSKCRYPPSYSSVMLTISDEKQTK